MSMQLTEEEQEDMRLGEIIDSIIEERLLEDRWEYDIEDLMAAYTLDRVYAEELKETIGSELGLIK